MTFLPEFSKPEERSAEEWKEGRFWIKKGVEEKLKVSGLMCMQRYQVRSGKEQSKRKQHGSCGRGGEGSSAALPAPFKCQQGSFHKKNASWGGRKQAECQDQLAAWEKTTVLLNSVTWSTGRLPLPPHRRYSRPVKRIIKGAIKRRQISGIQQWDWAEGRAGRAGLLQLCEHLGPCRGGWLWRHAFCLQRWQGKGRGCPWPRTMWGSGPSADQKCMRIGPSLCFLVVFIRQSAKEMLEDVTGPVKPLVWKLSCGSLSLVPVFIDLHAFLLVLLLPHCPGESACATMRGTSPVPLTTTLHFEWPDP